jgi:hypothetical protein
MRETTPWHPWVVALLLVVASCGQSPEEAELVQLEIRNDHAESAVFEIGAAYFKENGGQTLHELLFQGRISGKSGMVLEVSPLRNSEIVFNVMVSRDDEEQVFNPITETVLEGGTYQIIYTYDEAALRAKISHGWKQ